MPTPSHRVGRALRSPDRFSLRRAASTFAAASAVAAVLPAGAAAFGGPGAFDPANAATPAKFPGTQTVVDSWKLTGTGLTGNPAVPRTASQSLVAPRWVIGSRHSALQVGNEFVSPTGQRAIVQAVYIPTQVVDHTAPNGEEIGNWAPDDDEQDDTADISLALLDRTISPPAGGFPQLLEDRITQEAVSTLDGYVLWSGQFGTSAEGQVRSGWTKPTGGPVTNGAEVIASHGDSGSAGAWYRTPTSTPIIASITQGGATSPFWGRDVRLAAPLKPSSSESYATIAAWIKAKVAARQATTSNLAAPTWTTFAGAGVNLAALRPAAPLVVPTAATPTSITFGWDAPTDARLKQPTSYRATLTPGNVVRTFAAHERSTTFHGLQTGATYHLEVEALNGATASVAAPTLRPGLGVASYLTRANPPKPSVHSLVPSRTLSNGKANYCVEISATSPRYDVAADYSPRIVATIDGVRAPGFIHLVGETATHLSYRRTFCTPDVPLQPETEHVVVLRTVHYANVSAFAIEPFTTPAGPAAGTVLPTATNVTLTPRRAAADGKVDYCIDASWTNPVTLPGLPHTESSLLLRRTDASGEGDFADGISPSDDDHTFCGLKPSGQYEVTVFTQTGEANPFTKKATSTPAGAPQGTVFPGVTGFTKTTRKRGPGDYCVKASWTPAAPVAGFPVGGYVLVVLSLSPAIYQDLEVGPSATSAEICGLPASTNFIVGGGTYFPLTSGDPATVGFPAGGATTPA